MKAVIIVVMLALAFGSEASVVPLVASPSLVVGPTVVAGPAVVPAPLWPAPVKLVVPNGAIDLSG
ncbi:adult cuticle protein 1-like [Hermetia illucens]|uniref:adult cuticle protein 1-like n=1 Tax=Hermetia illucens TaxID=343691 RepID=UPI0018CC7042|nr:adult cuticle protein 1-like [Hermetia illucens]